MSINLIAHRFTLNKPAECSENIAFCTKNYFKIQQQQQRQRKTHHFRFYHFIHVYFNSDEMRTDDRPLMQSQKKKSKMK